MDGRPSPLPRSRPAGQPRRTSMEMALDAIGRSSAVSSRPDLRRPPVAMAAERRPAGMSATSQQIQGQASRHRIAADNADRRSSVVPMMYQDPLSMIDDYSTMSPGYYTTLLNQEPEDVFACHGNMESENEVMESPPLNDSNSQSKPKGRSKNFNEAEDILLISAYLNISKDAVTGRDQKEGNFWERVEKYFHVNRTFESDRNWSLLKHRWGIIHKEVSIFQGFHDSIERKNESGKTSDDKLAEANVMFHQIKNKAFSLFHAWNILRHEPKWAEDKASNEGNANRDSHPNAERPAGRKAEKEKMKAKKRSNNEESDPFIEEVKKMRESRDKIERERKERDERFFELDKKKVDLEQDQHDKSIMALDTSTMDDQGKRYFQLMKDEILARRFGSTQP